MHIAAAPQITLIIAAAMGLLNLWLAVRIIRVRVSHNVALGHGEVPGMEGRCRAHANFTEYVPIALILMGLIELNVGPSHWLWAIGALLVVARILHPFGMDRPAPNPYRALGVLLTLLGLVLLVLWAIAISYGVRI